MKRLYFDCVAGISGDMLLGALLDAGVPLKELNGVLRRLKVKGFQLHPRRVKMHGISGIRCRVQITHPKGHTTIKEIMRVIQSSMLPARVKERSKEVFWCLAGAEAKVHRSRPENITFHEVGALDSIIDVVGSIAGFEILGIDEFFSSPLPLNRGWVKMGHGVIPLPAPATLELSKGMPVTDIKSNRELVTPTGAAILKALCTGFGGIPSMNIERIGYGAGDYTELPIPDILRIIVGSEDSRGYQGMWMIETNIDDMNPQLFEDTFERLFRAGASDVFVTAVTMKKGRPGFLLSVLADNAHREVIEKEIFSSTTSIGVRSYEVKRRTLERGWKLKEIDGVRIRYKVARAENKIFNEVPEFEDLKKLGKAKGIPLKEAYKLALREL